MSESVNGFLDYPAELRIPVSRRNSSRSRMESYPTMMISPGPPAKSFCASFVNPSRFMLRRLLRNSMIEPMRSTFFSPALMRYTGNAGSAMRCPRFESNSCDLQKRRMMLISQANSRPLLQLFQKPGFYEVIAVAGTEVLRLRNYFPMFSRIFTV